MAGRGRSAGVLAFRRRSEGPEFLLVHPGGPFWRKRDDGAWSIPKGLIGDAEPELAAAVREFEEEVGFALGGDFQRLADQRQPGGKLVLCWLIEADLDLAGFRSNTFELEWPPKSGRIAVFPECDRAAYFSVDTARQKLLPGQRGFLDDALGRLEEGRPG